MGYNFYGWENATVPPINIDFKGIASPQKLYDALTNIWCEYTCAPRLREKWSKDNVTLGQCSITAFLAQDIFGGKVYGDLARYTLAGHSIRGVNSSSFSLSSLFIAL